MKKMFAIRNIKANKNETKPVPTKSRNVNPHPSKLNHLTSFHLGKVSNMGFCNGPWFVNPYFHLARAPFAGVVLLSGVGAKPPPNGV
jgi:hypothetical protein